MIDVVPSCFAHIRGQWSAGGLVRTDDAGCRCFLVEE